MRENIASLVSPAVGLLAVIAAWLGALNVARGICGCQNLNTIDCGPAAHEDHF